LNAHAAESSEPIAFDQMAPPEKPTPESLHAEIEELFAELWQVPRFAGLRRGFRPNVDSYHTLEPHELTVVVEVPGIDPKTLTIAVSERTLLIAGERARESSSGRVYQQMEIEYGLFQRQIRLSEDVDPEKARATYEHGIVTISLPVAEKPPPATRYAILVERA
jgi:HSP20 family protein